MRTKADNCGHGQARDALLRAAIAFDELAERAERIEKVSSLRNKTASAGRWR
jgi:hypothetical protein